MAGQGASRKLAGALRFSQRTERKSQRHQRFLRAERYWRFLKRCSLLTASVPFGRVESPDIQ